VAPLLAGAVVAGVLGALLALGIRHAQEHQRPTLAHSRAKMATFVLGLSLFLLACGLPGTSVLPTMMSHVLLAFVVPPLVLLGVPRAALLPLFAHRRPRRVLQMATRPARAAVIFLVVFFGCYLPSVLNATMASGGLRFAMGMVILAASVLFWWPLIEPFPVWDRELADIGKLLYLFIGSSVLKALGFILAIVPRPIYTLPRPPRALWQLSAINDQQYAGWLMVCAGTFVLLAAATVVCAHLLHDPEEDDVPATGRPAPSRRSDAELA
jgi:cytochrome c oxidase assembly factor CtaG